VAPSVVVAVMRSHPPSLLSTLTPSPVMRPLALMEHPVSPVMLSQVKDILATSGMVQAIHARLNPPPASSPSVSSTNMKIDSEDESPSTAPSYATSLNLWQDSHPSLDLQAWSPEWTSWFQSALSDGIPVKGLQDFIMFCGNLVPDARSRQKWTWVKRTVLWNLTHDRGVPGQQTLGCIRL